MPLAYNELYLIVPKDRFEDERYIFPAGKVTVHELLHLNILNVQYNTAEASLVHKSVISLELVKFFENYWVLPNWIQQDNEWILEEFFSFIASTYESSFHYENNLSCYDHLIYLALEKKDSFTSSALDFGCGTGIVIESLSVSKIESIVGFDFCNEMRKISISKGLKTLSVLKFNSLPENQFDIILLNYVLHFGIPHNSLNNLLGLLVEGGVLVGNIHKTLGLNNIRVWLDSLIKNDFFHQIEASRYGSIILIKKL